MEPMTALFARNVRRSPQPVPSRPGVRLYGGNEIERVRC